MATERFANRVDAAGANVSNGGRGTGLTVYQYTGLIFGIGALLLIALALFTASDVREFNALSEQTRHTAARQDLEQAVRTLLADSRNILREVALWDETQRQLENSEFYHFWWRNRLMNPARVPHYVQAMEVYNADGKSLSAVQETPLPGNISGPGAYLSWDGYGNSLFQFVPILDARGTWPPNGYLGVRISLTDAILDLYQFNHLVAESLQFDLPADERLAPQTLPELAEYRLPAHSEMQRLVQAVNRGTLELVALNMLVLVLGVWGIHVLVSRPLHLLERQVSRMDSDTGQTAARFPHFRVRELDQLGGTIAHYQGALGELTEDLDQKNAELWSLAHLDPLTGVRNRRAFEEDWSQVLRHAGHEPQPISFVMFDCDQLKYINDTYGHETGDRVIRTVARVVSVQLPAGAHLYRLGGDEFATVLVGTGAEDAKALVNRCQSAVAGQAVDDSSPGVPLRISTGLSHAEAGDHTALGHLPREADLAMYRSKRSNRIRPLAG
jgi:diguanylate cyclase (GGDEF)-like protein